MGAYNDIRGRENHLVRVRRMLTYKVPEFGTPPVQPLSQQGEKSTPPPEVCVKIG